MQCCPSRWQGAHEGFCPSHCSVGKKEERHQFAAKSVADDSTLSHFSFLFMTLPACNPSGLALGDWLRAGGGRRGRGGQGLTVVGHGRNCREQRPVPRWVAAHGGRWTAQGSAARLGVSHAGPLTGVCRTRRIQHRTHRCCHLCAHARWRIWRQALLRGGSSVDRPRNAADRVVATQ